MLGFVCCDFLYSLLRKSPKLIEQEVKNQED